eukprot:TRINITY_DN9581_c0_g1_i4.p1 TRINITY_DN9581_c0_g1~~TRINITY_DN9581_c0_g1_i4.p1  ORF type:complete len:167 (+),score=19.51 TRINITY_DN9581_c0_g1_i4:2-502(+)
MHVYRWFLLLVICVFACMQPILYGYAGMNAALIQARRPSVRSAITGRSRANSDAEHPHSLEFRFERVRSHRSRMSDPDFQQDDARVRRTASRSVPDLRPKLVEQGSLEQELLDWRHGQPRPITRSTVVTPGVALRSDSLVSADGIRRESYAESVLLEDAKICVTDV